ncbi:hypothetical protein FHT80_002793 [Rhizobium sp. BK226]|nr:hypothetical protein [Rhizobium sp. BK226]
METDDYIELFKAANNIIYLFRLLKEFIERKTKQ